MADHEYKTTQRQLPTKNGSPPDRIGHAERKLEVWPDRICSYCNRKVELVRWEESTTNTDSDFHKSNQSYSGQKPCCIKCGNRTKEDVIADKRPQEWKQPFLCIFHESNGISVEHPAVENLMMEYVRSPREFLWASVNDLKVVDEIGDEIATKIHVTRKVLYPDHSPPVDGTVCESRRQKLVDVDPEMLAEDLIVGSIDKNDLPEAPTEPQQQVLNQTAEELKGKDPNEFWPAKSKTSIDRIISEIKSD